MLPCKRFDIGVLMDESTTCAMRTFQPDANPKMAVDVRSKSLYGYFSVTIHEPRPFRPAVSEVSPSTFRLKIPFLQLGRVWEIDGPNSYEKSIIIILDSPPICHRLSADIQGSFTSSSTWRDTDRWLRQTAIVHNLGSQDQARTNLRRTGQIVDLGMSYSMHV